MNITSNIDGINKRINALTKLISNLTSVESRNNNGGTNMDVVIKSIREYNNDPNNLEKLPIQFKNSLYSLENVSVINYIEQSILVMDVVILASVLVVTYKRIIESN